MTDSASSPPELSMFAEYRVRILLGFVASLGLVILLLNLPFHGPPNRSGWSPHSPTLPPEHIELSHVRAESPEKGASSKTGTGTAPPVNTRIPKPEQKARSKSPPASSSSSSRTGDSKESQRSTVRSIDALDPTDEKPKMIGGMGALYLNIKYPEKARRQGIEGKLKLEFTVQPSGKVSNVEIVKSLHPLCDSAAVEGVRSVMFTPAEHDGTPIPTRMRLPVRFQLINISTPTETADVNS